MNAQQGSMRYWLQRIKLISLPHGMYPFNNRKWRYKGKRDERAVRSMIKELREIADGLEKRGNLK